MLMATASIDSSGDTVTFNINIPGALINIFTTYSIQVTNTSTGTTYTTPYTDSTQNQYVYPQSSDPPLVLGNSYSASVCFCNICTNIGTWVPSTGPSAPPTPYTYPGVYQNDATSLWVIPYDCDTSNKLYYWGSSGDSSFVTLDTSYSPSLYTITGLVPGTTYLMFSSLDGITTDTNYTTSFLMQQITTGVPASVFVINNSSVGIQIPDYDSGPNIQVLTANGILQTIPAQGQGVMTVVSNLVPGTTFSLFTYFPNGGGPYGGGGYQYGSFNPFCSNVSSQATVSPPQQPISSQAPVYPHAPVAAYTKPPSQDGFPLILIILIILCFVIV